MPSASEDPRSTCTQRHRRERGSRVLSAVRATRDGTPFQSTYPSDTAEATRSSTTPSTALTVESQANLSAQSSDYRYPPTKRWKNPASQRSGTETTSTDPPIADSKMGMAARSNRISASPAYDRSPACRTIIPTTNGPARSASESHCMGQTGGGNQKRHIPAPVVAQHTEKQQHGHPARRRQPYRGHQLVGVHDIVALERRRGAIGRRVARARLA